MRNVHVEFKQNSLRSRLKHSTPQALQTQAPPAEAPAEPATLLHRWFQPIVLINLKLPYPEQSQHPLNAAAEHWLDTAIAAWQSVTGNTLELKRAEHSADSIAIHISWLQQPHPHKPFETGRCTPEYSGLVEGKQRLQKVNIELQKHPRINQHLSIDQQHQQYYATLLHELGHALGLEHAQMPHSVMFHKSLQNNQLSPEDVALFKRLYS